MFLCHIKVHRCAVKHISVRSLNFYKRISLAVFQFFRCHKLSVCVGVESINRCRSRISEGHCYLIAVRVKDFEACTGIRNVFTAFCVHLDNLDIAFKVCVVDKIAVGLSVLSNEHIKVLHQLTTFPTGGLMNGIYAVRHILCLPETVFITDNDISFIFFCCVKTAGRFEIDFKGCSVFRCFNLSFAVIGVLDNGDIAFHNLFGYIICGLIVFHSIELRFSTDLMDCTVEQITLGRRDFTDCPVIITDIFLCGKLPVLIRHILVHKGFTFIDTVNCSGKGSVALRCSFLSVALCYGYAELFENVREVSCGYFFPVNRCGLICRHNITDCGIHFLNGVWGSAADKHIIKRSNTVLICHGILIDSNTGKRCAVKMEGNALNQVILRRFDDLKITSFENIIEIDL